MEASSADLSKVLVKKKKKGAFCGIAFSTACACRLFKLFSALSQVQGQEVHLLTPAADILPVWAQK